ncbi:MAG: tripartite tricarboxylate transporter TctB family protein [candidate division NC10 bacterium]|nr:tripartite tricarboxylate transporter TctB family protein [candidate division NC10 bacterium]
MWHARVFGGVAVLALGLAVIFFSRQLPYHSDYGPGPGFLPMWIGYVLVLCSLVVTVQELRRSNTGETFFQPRTRMALKVLVVIAIAFLLFPLLGFSVVFGLFICATMRLMGGHRWVTCGVAAIVTAVGIHYLFGHWLDIPLPTGLVGW